MKRQIAFARSIALALVLTLVTVPVTGYAASPGTNGQIVFASNRDGNTEIYTMNADGSGQTRLTNNVATDGTPAWSPDGMQIAFASFRDGNPEIYTMNADGSGQTRLTNNVARDESPTWSPDGMQIAFTSTRDGNHEVYVMNADGSNLANLSNNPASDFYPDWQPLPSTPRQAIERLIVEVNTLVLNPGQGNALIAKLEAAIQQLDQGHDATAINQLDSFVNQVSAMMSSGLLSPVEGPALLDAANAIIAALGG